MTERHNTKQLRFEIDKDDESIATESDRTVLASNVTAAGRKGGREQQEQQVVLHETREQPTLPFSSLFILFHSTHKTSSFSPCSIELYSFPAR